VMATEILNTVMKISLITPIVKKSQFIFTGTALRM